VLFFKNNSRGAASSISASHAVKLDALLAVGTTGFPTTTSGQDPSTANEPKKFKIRFLSHRKKIN
jgi:hypothetical protein